METTEPTESQTLLPFAKHHAFIIGIDDYQHISPLKTAVDDARKLAEVLTLQQHFEVHPPLLNATKEVIENLLQKTLRETVGKDDRVLFYFAGHGIAADGEDGPAGYIVPADAVPSDVKTFIPMAELQAKLDELPCRHLLLILDCCFSGAFKWSSQYRAFGTLMPKKIFKERFDRFIMDPAWQVITSAAYDQKALDVLQGKATGDRGVTKSDDESPHSPFALALFEGLAGEADAKVGQEGDGVITVTELYSYIRDQIEPATIQENQKLRQTPGFFPLRKHDKGEFIFLHPRHRLNLPPIPKRSPYKGLQSFDESDKDLFYGRDRAIKELRAKAETGKLLVVSGASGTGKSSVIKAGLLPVLREQGYRILPVIRPGINPMAVLEKALQDADASAPDGAAIGKAGGQKIVLLVDQYEELITRCTDPAERAQFVARLRKLLDESPAETFRIILTVRADFEPQLNDGELKEYWIPGRYTVPPFSVEELKEIIIMPLIQEVLIFDPPDLVDALIEEVVQSPGALPLLAYTLSELYEAYRTSGRQDRALKKEDYDRLGGVMGALRTKADALYKDLGIEEQGTMRKIMLRMISLEGEVAGKRVVMDELKYVDPAENQRVQGVIDQLVNARLIVKGKDYIEPAHDALVRAWKTLREWVHTIGEDKIVLNTKLNVAANEFAQSRNVKFLWNENPHLGVLQAELANPSQWFNAKEIDFIHQSVRRKKRLSRILQSITAGVVTALSALTVWALVSRHEATQNLKTAQTNLLSIRARENLATDHTRALRLAEAAYAILEDEPPVVAQQILSDAFHTLHDSSAFYSASLHHAGGVTAIAFSPRGDCILTGSKDHTAMLWDLSGHPLHTLSHSDEVTLAEFSRSGRYMVTATIDGNVWLWDSSGSCQDTIQHAKEISSAVISPDENFILTACADDTARLWDLRGRLQAAFPHKDEVFSARFDSAGRKILTASADGTARLWDLQGHPLRTFQHAGQVNEARFSPDGEKILTASRDGTSRLWDVNGKPLARLPHRREVFSAVFSPDGQRILTASADSSARLWTLQGQPLAICEERREVTDAAFSNDGKRILSTGGDYSAKLWDLTGVMIASFEHAGEVGHALLSSDGMAVLTASEDSTAKLWDLRELQFQHLRQSGTWAAYSPGGNRFLTLSDDHVARLWDSGGELVASLPLAHQLTSAVFSPRGERILILAEDHFAGLWSPAGGMVDSLPHESDIRSAVFSPNGKHLVTVDFGDNAWLWDVPDKSPAESVPLTLGQLSVTNSAVFSADGKRLLTAAKDGFARIWDTSGLALDSLDHKGNQLKSAIFSPHSAHILTASEDGFVRVWDERRKVIDSLQTGDVSQLVISPKDEEQLVTIVRNGPSVLWDTRQKRSVPLEQATSVTPVFSPDGKSVLTASSEGIARLWNLEGECRSTFDKHHRKEIKSAGFSPDGKWILTAGLDSTVKFWWTPRTIYDWLKRADVRSFSVREKEEYGINEKR